jgi:hypothetical protein
MTGAVPEGDPRAAEITEKGLLLRKPFFPQELLDFLGDWSGRESPIL